MRSRIIPWLCSPSPGSPTTARRHTITAPGPWSPGVDGSERNIKYNRLDDRSRPDYAELEERCTFTAKPGDVICLKPRGIHLIWNDNDVVTVSLHTYGRHFNYTGRSAFNPETNEVTPFVVEVK